MYECPTIRSLSYLLYVFITVSLDSAPSLVEIPPGDEEVFDWQSTTLATTTVVKLRKGKGEIPLIVFPGRFSLFERDPTSLFSGIGGHALHFKTFPETFHTAVSAIQITEETPQTCSKDQASFFYKKIKVSQ